MNDFINTELFAALAGAICGGFLALSGSIAIILINFFLKRIGKSIIIDNKSEIEYEKTDERYGGYIKVNELEIADRIVISIHVNIYNQSEISKTLSDFHIEVESQGKCKTYPVKEIHWHSQKSGLPYAPVSYSKNVSAITISPKDTEEIKCKSFLKKEEIPNSIDNVFLLAKYPSGKKFREKLL